VSELEAVQIHPYLRLWMHNDHLEAKRHYPLQHQYVLIEHLRFAQQRS
jgi:hypothetical protein